MCFQVVFSIPSLRSELVVPLGSQLGVACTVLKRVLRKELAKLMLSSVVL